MKVIKKDGTIEQFDGQKIVNAVSKSAARAIRNNKIKAYSRKHE